MNYEEIENFIRVNSIERRADLFDKNKKVYKSFKKLSKQEQDKLLPAKLNYRSNFNTVDDFKKFMTEKSIKTRADLRYQYPGIFIRFNEVLTEKEQELILPFKIKKCPPLTTEEDAKLFIKGNHIVSRKDFQERFPTAYNKFLKLENDIKNRLLPVSKAYTKSDIINFITVNNIKSRNELYNRSRIFYGRFNKLTKEERDSIFPQTKNSYVGLNTAKDFSEFIQLNNITSRGDFSKRFRNGYERFMTKLTREEQNRILPSLVTKDYTKLITKEDFKKFIQENDIKSRKQFDRVAYKGYVRFKSLLTKEEQDELLPPLYHDFSFLTDFNSFKLFIEENNIVSRKDLELRFHSGVSERFRKLLTDDEKEALLPMIKSLGEKKLGELLTANQINFETEKTFLDLRGDGDVCLRYDFYLLDYNILLEYHGSQHFNPNTGFFTDRGIELDKIKYNYAKNNNIPLLYFTNEVYCYTRFGYFTEVITDADILIEEIKKIGLTNRSNS